MKCHLWKSNKFSRLLRSTSTNNSVFLTITTSKDLVLTRDYDSSGDENDETYSSHFNGTAPPLAEYRGTTVLVVKNLKIRHIKKVVLRTHSFLSY